MIPNLAMSYEAAKYEIIKKISDKVEIRQYQKLTLATISANKQKSQNMSYA